MGVPIFPCFIAGATAGARPPRRHGLKYGESPKAHGSTLLPSRPGGSKLPSPPLPSIYIYIYIYAYMHIYNYTYTLYMHIHMHMYMYLYVHVCVCAHMTMYGRACVRVFACGCEYVNVQQHVDVLYTYE